MAKKNEFVQSNPFDVLYPNGEVIPQDESNPNLGQQAIDSTIEEIRTEERQARANHVDKYVAGLMANITHARDPSLDLNQELLRQNFKARTDPTYEQQRQEAINVVGGAQQEAFVNSVEEEFSVKTPDSEELQEASEISLLIDAENRDKSIGDLFVDSFSLEEDDLKRQEQYFQANALKDISDLIEDQSFIDKVVNYTGLFFLSDLGIDWDRVVGGGLIDTGEKAESFVNKFQSLPPEVKERLWPQIKGAITEATDENNVKTALALATLLDPTAPEELRDEIALSNVFLGADVGTLGAAIVTRISKMIKAANTINKLAKVGATERAAAVNAAAGLDKSGDVLKNAGVAKDIPATNASPFKMEDLIPEATDGINKETQYILREVEAGRAETAQRLNSVVEDSVKEGMLWEREKARVQDKVARAVDKYREEVYEQHGWSLEDVAISDSTEEGFTVSYKIEGVPAERKITYTQDDIGRFEARVPDEELKTGAIEGYLASPQFKLSDKELVGSATVVELQRARIWEEFARQTSSITQKHLGSPLNPINRKKYKNVDDVLLAGDDFETAAGEAGKVYSIQELRTGVRTRDDRIVKLSDKEIVAYYKLRDLFDNAWVMKNQSTRKALQLNGVKEVNFEGVKTLAKPFDSVQAAQKSLEGGNVHSIFNPLHDSGKGGIVRAADVDLEDVYSRGYKVVRFHKGSQEHGQRFTKNEFITHTIVKDDDVAELPLHVIHYKKGYVPRIDKSGFYFVKEPIKGTLDGVKDKVIGSRTLRIFDNKKQADAYAKSLSDENPGKEYSVLHDRQMAQSDLADEAVGISGGLYTSPRATHPVLFGEKGTARPRLSAFESLQRNLQHLSNLIPRNEWRIGVQQRWLNTAYDMFEKTGVGLRRGEDFHSAIRGESHTKGWRSLNESRKYINDQLRIPTTEEKVFEDSVRGMIEWAEGVPLLGAKKLQPVRNSVMRLGQKDPFAEARSLTFHALLGWFNPAQLIVQAQGFSVAFGAHPEHAMKVMRSYAPLRHMMHLPPGAPTKQVEAQANLWSKAVGVPKEEIIENYNLWRRSGLQESIRSTADHAASVQGYGMTSTALRSIADKGLVFYREGEFVTRGYGLMTAKEIWKKANPGKAIDTAAEKEILKNAMALQLNLTRANRAAWQRGALSIPTQFLQIQTKFVEKLFGKDLTGAQKAKLLSTQLGLYGSAGVIGGQWMINEGANMMGVTPEEVDPELKRWLRGGIYDYMLYSLFDADVSVGKRGAIASGVEEFLHSLIYEGTPTAEAMVGAFGSTASRTAEAFRNIKPLIITAATGDADLTADDFKFMANEFGKITSTWRSIDKAMFLHRSGMAITGRGNITIDNSIRPGFNSTELIARAMGFQLSEIQDVYDLNKWAREEKSHLESRVDALINVHYNYASREANDVDRGRTTQLMNNYLLQDLNPSQRQVVRDKVNRRIKQGEDLRSRVIRQYYRDRAIDITNSLTSLPITNVTIPSPEEEK